MSGEIRTIEINGQVFPVNRSKWTNFKKWLYHKLNLSHTKAKYKINPVDEFGFAGQISTVDLIDDNGKSFRVYSIVTGSEYLEEKG